VRRIRVPRSGVQEAECQVQRSSRWIDLECRRVEREGQARFHGDRFARGGLGGSTAERRKCDWDGVPTCIQVRRAAQKKGVR